MVYVWRVMVDNELALILHIEREKKLSYCINKGTLSNNAIEMK